VEILFWIFVIILILAGLLVGVLFSFYFLQEKLIFSPIKLPKQYPYPFDSEFEELNLEVEHKVNLNALLFKTNSKVRKGVVFYIHGNADNLRYWGDFADFFTQLKHDVFMYDFRGFGKSDGSIRSEKKLHRDAEILYHYLLRQYSEDEIVIYGFSLGTGIAAKLASEHKAKALILEAPYYNFIGLVNYHKAYLPARLISKYRFKINRFLKKVDFPVYIFHGTEDRKVPFYLGEKLKDVSDQIRFFEVKNATHNEMQEMTKYREEMKKILLD